MKKYLISFLIIICVIFSTFGAAACAPDGLEAHRWSDEWASNSKSHWRNCLDAGCNGRIDFEEHEWELTQTYEAATCGDTGLGQYTCSVCKATMGNQSSPATIPATGEHSYQLETVDVEPTCGEDGYGSYVCEVCFDFAVFPIPATGEHDFSGKYVISEQGHYHTCLHGCGTNEEIKEHIAGEGQRTEPSGTKDGKIEYRCTECNYLMASDVIPNPNIPVRLEVKFVKVTNSSKVEIPKLGEDGELYVTLSTSSNAYGGYSLELTGYNSAGDIVPVTNVKLYYYNEYTAEMNILDLQHSGLESTGYLGYVNNFFYVTRASSDVSLMIESTPAGRDPVYLKVHISAG